MAAAGKAVRDNRALAKLMGTKLQLDELVKETRLKNAKDAHAQLINEESESINEIYASAQKQLSMARHSQLHLKPLRSKSLK